MSTFIMIPRGIDRQFAKRVAWWKETNPIPVLSPPQRSVLPVRILDDPDFVEAMPALAGLPQLDESEIEFMPYE